MNNLGRGSENKNDREGIFTRETAGIILILFAVVSLVFLITRRTVFGEVGFAVSSFLLGVFGYCSYAVLAALAYGGVVLIRGKKSSAPRRRVLLCALLFALLVFLVHTVTAQTGGIAYEGYGDYLAACYRMGENPFFQTTGGGVVAGLIVYPVVKLTTSIGAYIIFSLLIIGCIYLIYATESAARNAKRAARTQPAAADFATSDTSHLYSLGYADPALQASQQAMQQPAAPQQTYAQPQQYTQSQQYAQQQAYAPQQEEDPAQRSKRLFAVGEDFSMKTKREMRQETRQEMRRAEQPRQTPMTPYAQSHSILYPDRSGESYSWYNERFGTSSSAPARSSKTVEPAPYGSYTSNGIFDKDSYFNNPNRRAISREQYSKNFGGSDSKLSEGHQLSSQRTPAPQEPAKPAAQPAQEEKPASSYSEMYAQAEENITYSERPKKIVTDTTADASAPARDYYRNDVSTDFSAGTSAGTSASTAAPAHDYYRNDVSSDFSAGTRETPAEEAVPPQDVQVPPVNRAETAESTPPSPPQYGRAKGTRQGIDVSETMRRAGFGSLPSRSVPAEPSEPARPAFSAPQQAEPPAQPAPRVQDEPARPSRFEETSREAETRSSRFSEEPPARSERASRFTRAEEPADDFGSQPQEEESSLKPIKDELDSAVNMLDDLDEDEPESSVIPDAVEQSRGRDRASRAEESRGRERTPIPPQPAQDQPRPKHVYAKYNPPPIELLQDYDAAGLDPDEIETNKDVIVETLYALKIQCEITGVMPGPSFTRYDIAVPGNIPLGRVLGCDKELAMRLHAKDGVNITTNYANGTISIEVPNKTRATVGLKEIIRSPAFTNSKPNSLTFALGKNIEGEAVCGDIAKMKHLLVSGATGSGKSISLHAMILSLLYKYSPEELRLIIIDPKQVDFAVYDKLPHLMINEILGNDLDKILNLLSWAVTEMDRRYQVFRDKARKGLPVRDLDSYNANLDETEERMPKIVIIIDELADLMARAKKDVEDRIQLLTAKARAAGMHMVLCTQRPSVNVITGVIKTNLPTRIALKLTSEVDSRTILDESGAEKLLGNGDMLYRTDSMTLPERLQGPFVSNEEMHSIVAYVREHNEAYFDDRVSDYLNNARASGAGGDADDGDSVEAVYIDALRYVVSIGQASISMIQRRCSVGYPKAGKIIEWMENMGYISAFDGAKSRKVLLTQEEFDSKYGDYGE